MNGSTNGNGVTWASAKARSEEVNGYPSFSTRNNGFFSRHARTISSSMPRFNLSSRKPYSDKEKLGRGRWHSSNGGRMSGLKTFLANVLRRMKLRFLLVIVILLAFILFYTTRQYQSPRVASLFTDSKNQLYIVYIEDRLFWEGGENSLLCWQPIKVEV